MNKYELNLTCSCGKVSLIDAIDMPEDSNAITFIVSEEKEMSIVCPECRNEFHITLKKLADQLVEAGDRELANGDIEHTITQEDLDMNPDLVEAGVEVGEEITIPVDAQFTPEEVNDLQEEYWNPLTGEVPTMPIKNYDNRKEEEEQLPIIPMIETGLLL